MSVRFFYRACLVVVAVALLPACGGDGRTDAESAASAMQEADGLFDTTDGGRTLVLTYPDGSQLLLSAAFYSSRGNFYRDCFPIDDPLSVSDVDGHPGDVRADISLEPCGA